MNRQNHAAAILLALAALACSPAHGQTLHLDIEGGVDHFINEVLPLHAAITDEFGHPVPTDSLTIRWETNQGCFSNCQSTDTFFTERDYTDTGPAEDHWLVTVWRDGEQISSTNYPQPDPANALWLASPAGPAPTAATSPQTAPPPVDAAQELSFYQSGGWSSNAGDAGPHAAEFIHEIYLAEHAPDRDARVDHFRKALALRPDASGNIVIEFNMAIALEQYTAPGQPVRPQDAAPIFKHIVEHYDHKAYHRSDMPGNNSNAPDMLVVRSAILLSELTTDPAEAEGYVKTAMSDLDWTFRTRKQDLLSAPAPSTEPSPFVPAEKRASQYASWEQKKADAAAGKVIGPYETSLATTAIQMLLGRHQTDRQAALQDVVDHYQGPLVTSALAEAAARHLTLAAAPTHPETAPPPTASTTAAPNPPVAALDQTSQPSSLWIISLCTLGAAALAALYLIRRLAQAKGLNASPKQSTRAP